MTGISTISNSEPIIYRNHIFGNVATGNTTGKTELRGIYCTENFHPRVRCNDMTDVGQCMVFEGTNIGSVWDNFMNNSTDGLVLINKGVIGPQMPSSPNTGIPSENLWTGPFAGSQTLVDANSFATLSKLYVLNTPTKLPVVNAGPIPNAYDPAAGPNQSIFIVTGNSNRNCNGPMFVQSNNGPQMRQLLRKIVQDSAPVTGYVQEGKWMNNQHVYDALRRDNSLMVGEPVLQQFYATSPFTSIGQVATADEQLLQTDSVGAATTNQSITPIVLPEQNYQDVNAIYIGMLGGTPADSTQLQTLEAIAAQCPAQGGIAVFRARSLLQMVDDNVRTWEDSCITGSSARMAPEEMVTAQAQRILLYPNPNDGNMVLQYTLAEGQQGQFIIYDLMGNIVDTEVLAPGTQTQSILMSGLASGIYFYQVMFDGQLIKSEKIVIQK